MPQLPDLIVRIADRRETLALAADAPAARARRGRRCVRTERAG